MVPGVQIPPHPLCPHSSVGQSVAFLKRRSQVRILLRVLIESGNGGTADASCLQELGLVCLGALSSAQNGSIPYMIQVRFLFSVSIFLEEWQSQVYRAGLLNQWTRNGPVGSNPSSSVTPSYPNRQRRLTQNQLMCGFDSLRGQLHGRSIRWLATELVLKTSELKSLVGSIPSPSVTKRDSTFSGAIPKSQIYMSGYRSLNVPSSSSSGS